MPILAFSNVSDTETPVDARFSSAAVRYVEPTRKDHPGKTVIHVLGQGENGITVMETIDVVAGSIVGLVFVEGTELRINDPLPVGL